jgi:hypothetical protein
MVDVDDDRRDYRYIMFAPAEKNGNIIERIAKMIQLEAKNNPDIVFAWSQEHYKQAVTYMMNKAVLAYDMLLDDEDPKKDPVCDTSKPQFVTTVIVNHNQEIAVCASWLLGEIAFDETEVVRDAIVDLFSHRHQPYRKELFDFNVKYPNTFDIIELGHEDCDNVCYPVLEKNNVFFSPTIDARAIYGDMADVFIKCNSTRIERFDMSLEDAAKIMRKQEINYTGMPVTERDIAKLLHQKGYHLFNVDPDLPGNDRRVTKEELNEMDDTVDMQCERAAFAVTSNGRRIPHWEHLWPDMPPADAENQYFAMMNHTSIEVVVDRLLLGIQAKDINLLSKTGYPAIYRLQFMKTNLTDTSKDMTEVLREREHAAPNQKHSASSYDALYTNKMLTTKLVKTHKSLQPRLHIVELDDDKDTDSVPQMFPSTTPRIAPPATPVNSPAPAYSRTHDVPQTPPVNTSHQYSSSMSSTSNQEEMMFDASIIESMFVDPNDIY